MCIYVYTYIYICIYIYISLDLYGGYTWGDWDFMLYGGLIFCGYLVEQKALSLGNWNKTPAS